MNHTGRLLLGLAEVTGVTDETVQSGLKALPITTTSRLMSNKENQYGSVRGSAFARICDGLWKRWYRYFNRKVEGEQIRFLNYGMVLRGGETLLLLPEDEGDRLSIQLYHRVVSAVDLSKSRVLEVSCGRGGGADYMTRYLHPRDVIALDRTESALLAAKQCRTSGSVKFVCGDAMCLPFADVSFDAVVNVEASHCYVDFERFLREVRRVLAPGGRFLYADFRLARKQDVWERQISESGMEVVASEDITDRVVESLNVDHDRKMSLIGRVAPRLLRRVFMAFAGNRGTVIHRAFERGRMQYVRFVLKRPS